MAKKRFTDNLFGLFEEETPRSEAPARAPKRSKKPRPADTEESVEVDVSVRGGRAKKKLSSKGFTQDLDAFLSDSFERASASPAPPEGAKPSTAPAATPTPTPRVPRRRRKAGLDLLIRSTISDEDRQSRREPKAPDTKRVTLVFNKQHLVKLKEEAAKKGLYLKDVVQQMVAEYLEK